ncbi:MAG: altronate dehydratase, partial [Burkholderiales bacterium]
MSTALFQIDPRDSVATALRDMAAGEAALGVILTTDVPKGHKVAVTPVAAGDAVLKFGFPIGRATQAIAPGEHVHIHNVKTALEGSGTYRYAPRHETRAPFEGPGFMGYRRADGRVGTRNEIWVIPTVGCVGRTAQKIAERAARLHEGQIDGVHAFAHPFGCSQLGDDLAGTRAILTALANHPNAGGVLIVGLGCESNQMSGMLAG